MDGKQGLDAGVPLVIGVEQPVVHRHQGGLPVVGMDDVGLEVDVGQHLQNGPGEKREPLRVVKVAVDAAALEVVLVIDEVVDHIVDLGLENAAILPPPCHRCKRLRPGRAERGPLAHRLRYGTSYFSAVVFVGYAGQFGWKYGIAATWAGLGNAFLGSLLAWAVLGRRTRVMTQHLDSATMPEFFGKRFEAAP